MIPTRATSKDSLLPTPNPHTREHLRASMRALRLAMPSASHDKASAMAGDFVARHLEELRPTTVALYSAFRRELDTTPLATTLRARGISLAYPRVVPDTNTLQFRLVESDRDFTRGTFGILEPSDSARLIPIHQIECFIVPGLAFDATGTRLGWGRGYYDTTLAQHPSAPRIGLAFAMQMVPTIPRNPRDVPMTAIASEHGVVQSRPT